MPTYTDRFVLTAEDRTKAATAAAQANFKRLEASAASLRTALGAVGGALILRQAAKFTGDTLNMAQAIGDTAEKAGLTAEQLQVLRFAADQNGSSAQALDKAMIRLNVSIGEAGRVALGLQDGTSVAGEAMQALGVDVLDAAGNVRSSAELFPELIDKLAAVENPAERAALAAQVFGKKIGPELAVLINQGSAPLAAYRQQLIDTGALIDNDLVQGARELADQFGRVGGAITTNFQRGFLQAFVGDFKDLESAVSDPQFVAAINTLGQQFGSAFKSIVDNAPVVLGHLREIRDIVVVIAAARLGTSLGSAFGPVGGAVGSAVGLAAGGAAVATLRSADAERDAGREEARIAAIEKKRASDSVEAVRRAGEANRAIIQATQQRLAVESGAASRSAKIHEDQTTRLKAALDQQKAAYRDATQAVADALREREAVEQEFDEFMARGRQATGRAPNLLAAVTAGNRARQALDAGDPKESLRLAREAAEVVDQLRQSDPGANLEIVAGKIAATARAAAQAQQMQAEQAQAQVQQVQATLQGLLEQAKSLEALKVGFDDQAAIAQAAALRAAIEAALAANPIVIPVTVASPDTSGAAPPIPGRAQGGPIPGRSPHPRADNVLIRATAGEWMIQQPSARYYGAELMQAINQRLIDREALLRALRRPTARPPIPGRAQGGPIPGRSPHPRADNVLIRATAGEWMIQQPSARYYGAELMQAINQRLIDREALMRALRQPTRRPSIPGRAQGGPIPGRSPHPRADNVLIRATAGEWMIQQPSARYYGGELMQAINQRLIDREALTAALPQRVPGYADGGLIAAITGPAAPRPSLAALAGNPALPAAPTTTINLTLPTGQTYTVRADTDTADALQRDIRLQALKRGKR